MVAKKKGAGGNLTRSQIVTVRLDPKLKFAAELAARKQRRTISSFIEWAVEEAVDMITINQTKTSIKDVMNRTWDVEEPDRIVKLALNYPEFLTFDEERLWKIISEQPYFWYRDWERGGGWQLVESWVNFENIRAQWATLNKIISGEATITDLPEGEENPNAPPMPLIDDSVPF